MIVEFLCLSYYVDLYLYSLCFPCAVACAHTYHAKLRKKNEYTKVLFIYFNKNKSLLADVKKKTYLCMLDYVFIIPCCAMSDSTDKGTLS